MKKSILTIAGCLLALIVCAQKVDTLSLSVNNKKLHAVLTQPTAKGNVPLVVFIAGSGPTDLDGNQPMVQSNCLKFLSNALVSNNIATLRYDKWGIAGSAEAGFDESKLIIDMYASDVVEIIRQMKARGFKDIYVAGHSEGSFIGLMALQQEQATGFISIAGMGITADELIKKQIKPQLPADLYNTASAIIDSLKQGHLVKNAPISLYSLFRPSVQPYMISWFKYSPVEMISKLKFPILILQGDNDLQVSVSDAQNLANANKNSKMVIIKKMNHVFKTIEGGVQDNYAAYTNPNLPINGELSSEIIRFINTNSK